jgi:hypothetical protein
MKGYADAEIESIFCKYDHDGDRVLSGREKIQLMLSIKNAKTNVLQEFQDFKKSHQDSTIKKDDVFA